MLKRMSLRKISVASLTLLILLLLYFIPTNKEEDINPMQELKYEYDNKIGISLQNENEKPYCNMEFSFS